MINVNCKIDVYEIEGKEVESKVASIKVFSHWNSPERVLIQVNDDPTYTVIAKDLIIAIQNAQNTNRF